MESTRGLREREHEGEEEREVHGLEEEEELEVRGLEEEERRTTEVSNRNKMYGACASGMEEREQEERAEFGEEHEERVERRARVEQREEQQVE